MECPTCGLPLVYDETDGSPFIWCPKCGRDWTYQCYEEGINDLVCLEDEPSRKASDVPSTPIHPSEDNPSSPCFCVDEKDKKKHGVVNQVRHQKLPSLFEDKEKHA